MADHARESRRFRRVAITGVVVGIAVAAGVGTFVALEKPATPRSSRHLDASVGTSQSAATQSSTATTSTPTTSTTFALPQPAGPGFIPGKVSAVGDSVMLDYQDPLKAAIPGISVDAAVSRQWSDGESILETMKAQGQLGADVIVGLGTNGPISQSDFDGMMFILGGASRVVFVNFHVDRPWQDPNNALLAQGAVHYPNVVVADWAGLAARNPQWFGSDGTHLGIDGPGADALANLVTATLANG